MLEKEHTTMKVSLYYGDGITEFIFFLKNRFVIAAMLLEQAFLKKAYHLRDRVVLLIVLRT